MNGERNLIEIRNIPQSSTITVPIPYNLYFKHLQIEFQSSFTTGYETLELLFFSI